jgi:hypothetical protein
LLPSEVVPEVAVVADIPTPFEADLDADMSRIMGDVLGPGLDVTLVSSEGDISPVRAVFAAPGTVVNPGQSHAPVVSTAPMLHMQESVLHCALGRRLSTRDRFIVRGESYTPQNPLSNGYGLLSIKLLRTGDLHA